MSSPRIRALPLLAALLFTPSISRAQPAGDGPVVLYGSITATRNALNMLRGTNLLDGDAERDLRLYLPPELKSDDQRFQSIVRPIPGPRPGPCGKVLAGFEIRAKPEVLEHYVGSIAPRGGADENKIFAVIPGLTRQTPVDPKFDLGPTVGDALGKLGVQSVTRPDPCRQ